MFWQSVAHRSNSCVCCLTYTGMGERELRKLVRNHCQEGVLRTDVAERFFPIDMRKLKSASQLTDLTISIVDTFELLFVDPQAFGTHNM